MASWMVVALMVACSGGTDAADGDAAKTEEAEPAGPPPTPEDVAAPPDSAEVTESGLASKVLKKGTGTEKPTPRARVTVHYTGWTASDGERFDSSLERGEPSTFGLNQVIAGWTEGLQLMVVGEKRRFWIPEELAYRGQPGKPAGMLTFDVELLEIDNPPVPPEQLEAPADAPKTENGIAYVTVVKGTGTEKVGADDIVHFEFAGWTPEGKPIQSSFGAPQTPRSRVSDLLPSWKEIVTNLVEGQRVVAYVPAGFDKVPGMPDSPVIFDFTIEKIEKPLPIPDTSPPADAKKTESGVSYQLLEEGAGDKIETTDIVGMNYTLWTASDGKMIDSTFSSDKPARVPVQRTPIPGWREVVMELSEGDKARAWIPAAQGFPAGNPRAPQGDLIMDIQVVDVTSLPKRPANPAAAPGGTKAPAPE